jgi:hypothetical protein
MNAASEPLGSPQDGLQQLAPLISTLRNVKSVQRLSSNMRLRNLLFFKHGIKAVVA